MKILLFMQVIIAQQTRISSSQRAARGLHSDTENGVPAGNWQAGAIDQPSVAMSITKR